MVSNQVAMVTMVTKQVAMVTMVTKQVATVTNHVAMLTNQVAMVTNQVAMVTNQVAVCHSLIELFSVVTFCTWLDVIQTRFYRSRERRVLGQTVGRGPGHVTSPQLPGEI